MAEIRLTAKQEAFCLAYIESGNATEAYRSSYDTKNQKPASINRIAKKLMDNVKIRSRIEELRAPVREKALLTLSSHLQRLDDLSRRAEDAGQFGPAIKAEESRGKAAGLYADTGKDDSEETPTPLEIHFHVKEAVGDIKTTNAKA